MFVLCHDEVGLLLTYIYHDCGGHVMTKDNYFYCYTVRILQAAYCGWGSEPPTTRPRTFSGHSFIPNQWYFQRIALEVKVGASENVARQDCPEAIIPSLQSENRSILKACFCFRWGIFILSNYPYSPIRSAEWNFLSILFSQETSRGRLNSAGHPRWVSWININLPYTESFHWSITLVLSTQTSNGCPGLQAEEFHITYW